MDTYAIGINGTWDTLEDENGEEQYATEEEALARIRELESADINDGCYVENAYSVFLLGYDGTE